MSNITNTDFINTASSVPSALKPQDTRGQLVTNSVEKAAKYGPSIIKFAKFQKALVPIATVLQASNAITYIEQCLVGLGSILGIASSIINIRQKNKFIEGLKALERGYFTSQKEKDDFIKLIETPEILEKCLSRDFIKNHNIHTDGFFGFKNGKRVVQLDLSIHNNLKAIIEQVELKKMMDIVKCMIYTLSLAIFIAGMAAMPPLWLSFFPIILFAIAYVLEKKIDYEGTPLSLEMLMPEFIKDIRSQGRIVELLEITDLHRHFKSNKALFSTYLKDEEIKELDEEIEKINKAKNSSQSRKAFSEKLKGALGRKTTQGKIETVGLGLLGSGGILMLAPLGPFGLIAVLPVVIAGIALKWKPSILMGK